MDRALVRDTRGYLPIVKTLFRRSFPVPNRYSKKKDLRPEGSIRMPNPLLPHLQIELHAYLLVLGSVFGSL